MLHTIKITYPFFDKRRPYYFLLLLFRRVHPPTERVLYELSMQKRILHSFLHNSGSLLEEGRRFLTQKQYTQALACFSILIQQDPNHEWAWHGKGDALQLLGKYEQAEKSYRNSITIAPNVALHWGGLANSLFGQKNYDEANIVWKKTQEMDPSLSWMRPK